LRKDIPAIAGGRPVRKKFLIFGKPQIGTKEIKEVASTIRSGWLSTGPKVKKFEDRFKRYIGSRHAIALNSCTAGLQLALEAAGVGKGDEVITTALTFAATANVIVHSGARPVFADVDPSTMNISPEEIEKKITKRTKAIMPVHMAGKPCDMAPIMSIARKHRLFVIEDAAHAIETRYRRRKIGDIGDATVFSFYATKNLTTGEGGMLTTNNSKWAEKIRILSLHGISKSAWTRYTEKGFRPYDILCAGYKFNMMDIQASLGLHQLARIEANLRIRRKYYKMYNKAFKPIPQIITPKEEKNIKDARHLYIILIDTDSLKIDRNKFIMALKAENIGSGIHFSAVHLSSFYKKRFGYRRGDLPNTEYISKRTLSLPLSAELKAGDIRDVIKAVKKITSYYKK
jgi:dTDP-4-amino-4,6-dideoxygalactose transaminase